MGNIAIVSCTSADLTPAQAKEAGVTLVPLKVSFGDETWDTVTELSNEDFYAKLTAPDAPFPKTAAVNPAQFETAFRDALDAGAEGVVCITISSGMSATYSAAVQAAEAFEAGVVQVVDSRTVTQPQGIIVRRAADLAATGAGQADIVDLCQDLVGRSRLNFTPNTLEYLQKGGRIGRASALLGGLLNIRPILTLVAGKIEPAGKVRGTKKAIAEIVARLQAHVAAHPGPLVLDFLHIQDAVAAETLRDAVRAAGIDFKDGQVYEIGAVIAAHVGPGTFGLYVTVEPG